MFSRAVPLLALFRKEVGRLPTCRYTAVPLSQQFPSHIKRSPQLLPGTDRPDFTLSLNRRNQRARYSCLLRKLLLSKLAMLTADTQRGLSLKSALGDLQRYEFVRAIVQARLGGVVRPHI